jgi:methyl-accepting chemotaxis protein
MEASRSVLGEAGIAAVEKSLKTGQIVSFAVRTDRLVSYPFYVGKTQTPWNITSIVPEKFVLSGVRALENFTLAFVAVAVLLSVLMAVLVSTSIAKPIVKVSHVLKDISEGEGDLTKAIPVKGNDEIAALSLSFNLTLE